MSNVSGGCGNVPRSFGDVRLIPHGPKKSSNGASLGNLDAEHLRELVPLGSIPPVAPEPGRSQNVVGRQQRLAVHLSGDADRGDSILPRRRRRLPLAKIGHGRSESVDPVGWSLLAYLALGRVGSWWDGQHVVAAFADGEDAVRGHRAINKDDREALRSAVDAEVVAAVHGLALHV